MATTADPFGRRSLSWERYRAGLDDDDDDERVSFDEISYQINLAFAAAPGRYRNSGCAGTTRVDSFGPTGTPSYTYCASDGRPGRYYCANYGSDTVVYVLCVFPRTHCRARILQLLLSAFRAPPVTFKAVPSGVDCLLKSLYCVFWRVAWLA